MPETDETERLAIPPGTPVVARTAYTTDGEVVEVNEMAADASSYVFRYDFDAQLPRLGSWKATLTRLHLEPGESKVSKANQAPP
jgi:hypothetical protein